MGSNEMTLKQFCLASIAILCYLQPNGAIEGKMITCACTTDECRVSYNVSTCSTKNICFTQLLFYSPNGPAHLSRGCIDYKTPLLCENQRPNTTFTPIWPILYCCNFSMCNRETTPTMPPWFSTTATSRTNIGTNVTTITDRQSTKTNSISTSSYTYSSGTQGTTLKNSLESTTTDPRPKIISPVYMTVLALGVAILVLIGLIAACILRRQQQQQRLYTRHWITMDHEAAGYLKGQPCLSPPADINFIKPGAGLQLVNVSTDDDDDGHENGSEIDRSRFTVDHRYPASLLLLHPSFTQGPINTSAPNAMPNSYMP